MWEVLEEGTENKSLGEVMNLLFHDPFFILLHKCNHIPAVVKVSGWEKKQDAKKKKDVYIKALGSNDDFTMVAC